MIDDSINLKKKKIMDAAIEEFANKGYRLSSTNNIIKNAGVSKGLLFHYYGNKKNLYVETIKYCYDFFSDELKDNAILNKSDIFDRFIAIAKEKNRLFNQYPHIYKLVFNEYKNPCDDIKQEMNNISEEIIEINKKLLFENLDYSLFRDDIPAQKIIEILLYVVNGISVKNEAVIKNENEDSLKLKMGDMIKEYNETVEILKKIFYK